MRHTRAFANEVEHNPFNTELFAAVLGAFHGKVDRPMNYEDFAHGPCHKTLGPVIAEFAFLLRYRRNANSAHSCSCINPSVVCVEGNC